VGSLRLLQSVLRILSFALHLFPNVSHLANVFHLPLYVLLLLCFKDKVSKLLLALKFRDVIGGLAPMVLAQS